MDLISGWINYDRGCGCPTQKALFAITYTASNSHFITVHNIDTGAFLGYWQSFVTGSAPTRGITDLDCLFYRTTSLSQKIAKTDSLTGDSVSFIPPTNLPFAGPTAIDNDGTNLWVLDDNAFDPSPTGLYIDPSNGTILNTISFNNAVRSPSPDEGEAFGLCFNGTDLVVQQQLGNIGDQSALSGIWDKYTTTGTLLTASFIDVSGHLTSGAVASLGAGASIVYTGTEYLIGDTLGDSIARCDVSGAFTGLTTLTSPVGVGSSFGAGATFSVLGILGNPFSLT